MKRGRTLMSNRATVSGIMPHIPPPPPPPEEVSARSTCGLVARDMLFDQSKAIFTLHRIAFLADTKSNLVYYVTYLTSVPL